MPESRLVSLLGQLLKSDVIARVIERYDMQQPDWDFQYLPAGLEGYYSARRAGFEFHFDELQRLDSIFCHIKPTRDCAAIDPALIGEPAHRTLEGARRAAEALGLPHTTHGTAEPGSWHSLRLEHPEHSVHYGFDNHGELDCITLMLPWVAKNPRDRSPSSRADH